jgi:predicted nucleic acid-binding protein
MRSILYPRSVLIDTGASLALSYPNDEHHLEARAIQRRLLLTRPRLYLTNFLVDETYTLILTRYGYRYAIEFLDRTEAGTITVIQVTSADEANARQLLRRFSDKRYSYTDATSFVIMERLRIEAAFTFDENFAQHGLLVLTP